MITKMKKAYKMKTEKRQILKLNNKFKTKNQTMRITLQINKADKKRENKLSIAN